MDEELTDEKLNKIVTPIFWVLLIIEIIYFAVRDYRLIFPPRLFFEAVWAFESLVHNA
jgi:hypothetical protein